MTDQQAPLNTPPPGGRGVRRAGKRLARLSILLSFVAPFAGILSFFVAASGMNCPTPPYDGGPVAPNYFLLSLASMSVLLYYGAILASATGVISGGMALRRLRRELLDQGYRANAIIGIVLGLLGGAFVIFPGYFIFSLLYYYGSRGLCLTI